MPWTCERRRRRRHARWRPCIPSLDPYLLGPYTFSTPGPLPLLIPVRHSMKACPHHHTDRAAPGYPARTLTQAAVLARYDHQAPPKRHHYQFGVVVVVKDMPHICVLPSLTMEQQQALYHNGRSFRINRLPQVPCWHPLCYMSSVERTHRMKSYAAIRESLLEQGFDRSRITVDDEGIEDGVRVGCSQCEALVINGVACHETGCPHIVTECFDEDDE
jgi:hypothetical protein